MEGDADIRRPQVVARRHEDIDPRDLPRADEHRSPSAAPPHNVHPRGRRTPGVDDLEWLRAPEHDGRSGHCRHAHDPPVGEGLRQHLVGASTGPFDAPRHRVRQ